MTAELGPGDYLVRVDGQLRHYSHWDDIPAEIDDLIRFAPTIPPGPHSEAQHAAIARLPEVLQQLRARERRHARRDPDR